LVHIYLFGFGKAKKVTKINSGKTVTSGAFFDPRDIA